MPQSDPPRPSPPAARPIGAAPLRLRITRSPAGPRAEGGSPDARPSLARSGRGATTNPHVRFEAQRTEAADDGWGSLEACFGDLPPLETTLIRDHTRTVIARNQSPDIGFDRSINPYRGCEHGCIYCFARPTHAYLGYSPGLDFETKLLFKPEVAALLEKELSRAGYRPQPITLGANTDPYQPIERQLRLTRQVLEVLRDFGHPVSIVTKSALVMRDRDILGEMAARGLAQVFVSLTTLDPTLARVMEPRASAPHLRLQAVAGLRAAGIPVGVLAAPMIPGLNDVELEALLDAAAQAGAERAGYVLLRLPLELAEMFEAWLHRHVPERAKHVLSLVRQMRGGALYDSTFGKRGVGTGPYADLLAQRFEKAAARRGLNQAMAKLELSHFGVPERLLTPPAQGVAERQMTLF